MMTEWEVSRGALKFLTSPFFGQRLFGLATALLSKAATVVRRDASFYCSYRSDRFDIRSAPIGDRSDRFSIRSALIGDRSDRFYIRSAPIGARSATDPANIYIRLVTDLAYRSPI